MFKVSWSKVKVTAWYNVSASRIVTRVWTDRLTEFRENYPIRTQRKWLRWPIGTIVPRLITLQRDLRQSKYPVVYHCRHYYYYFLLQLVNMGVINLLLCEEHQSARMPPKRCAATLPTFSFAQCWSHRCDVEQDWTTEEWCSDVTFDAESID